MNFITIITISIICLVALRIFTLSLGVTLFKILKYTTDGLKKSLIFSIMFLASYIIFFTSIAEIIITKNQLSYLEHYLTYTCIGVTCILWCYFKWELSWKTLPQFEDDEIMPIKKVLIFSIVMLITLIYGYQQMEKLFNGNTEDAVLILANATIVPGIIVFDRIMNQIIVLKKIKNDKNKNT
ncbi:MAG: hypothetical protein H2184_04275 [Candidatus Galacturonibacter soehngenii]|nr:hypothetical protein [Candidatus Galacturonibacter soehngenii]